MLVDVDDAKAETNDTIYYNNNATFFRNTPSSSRLYREDDQAAEDEWGVYPFKPVCQVSWDEKVTVAAVNAAEVNVDEKYTFTNDLRPRAYDYNSKMWLLLDSGTAVSCYPRHLYPEAQLDPDRALQAVNGAKIASYGQRHVKIDLGGRTYAHTFLLADINQVIAGWDFILKFRLDLQWLNTKQPKCQLKDTKANRIFPLALAKAPNNQVSLALVTYKQYSDKQKTMHKELVNIIPPDYKEIIDKYPKVRTVNFVTIPQHNVVHHIDTGTNPPCRAKVRHILPSSPKYVAGEKAVKELEKLGIVEKVGPNETTQWSSALPLAVKADGSLRPCGGYRALNNRTLLDIYPLPQLKEITPKLQGCKIFSTVDMLKSYHQIPLDGPSANKTCLLTSFGTYKFKRLAMGLKNSGQSFQKLMNFVLEGLGNTFCYLDDVLIYSKSESEHKQQLDKLFERLQKAGLTINEKKCNFGKSSVPFLGYEVNGRGIRPIKRKLEAIANFPPPSSPKELLGFLGAVNYSRRCLPRVDGINPAEAMKPLYSAATTKKPGVKFVDIWRENNLQKPFDQVKKMVMAATNLSHPRPDVPLSLSVDASNQAIGGSLDQFVQGRWEPLGFWSRKLQDNQTRWSCFRRELYAIQQGIRYFLDEIKGRHLIVWSDHKPITHAFRNPDAMPHDPIAYNQLVEVSFWTSDVRYKQAKNNCVADWLSRPSNVPLLRRLQVAR